MRRTPEGAEEVVCSGVFDYDFGDDGTVYWSNVSYVLYAAPGEKPKLLRKIAAAHHLAAR